MSVKSALRTLQILEAFAEAARPMSLGEVARAIDAPRSSVLALLATMVERGYLYRVGAAPS
jgi:DNA-binding IclR family transcriptional regulator